MAKKRSEPLAVYRPLDYEVLGEMRDTDNVLVNLNELRKYVPDAVVLVALNTTAYGNHDMHWSEEGQVDKILSEEKNLKLFEEAIARSQEVGFDNYTATFKKIVADKRMDRDTNGMLSMLNAMKPWKTRGS